METYRAAVASAFDKVVPLDALRVTEVSVPDVPPGWTRVRVRTASVNQHDVWTLRGVGGVHPGLESTGAALGELLSGSTPGKHVVVVA